MRSVLVDPDRRTARVGPGATWGDVIEAAAPFGLAPVSGTNATVGVTGFTFGGGHGFLSRKYGLAADNLIRADVVTADGETLTAREDRRRGLFWALRGAGGNFGVATSLEFGLHPLREVFGGVARFDRGLAPHLLARFREYAMPEALNVSVVVTPDAVALRGVYAGGADDAWRALAPLFLGEPFADTFRAMPYSETGTIGGTPPRRFELLRDVPVDAILRMADTADAVEVKRWGGAIARGTTPAGHRQVPFSVTVDGEDIDAARAARHRRFVPELPQGHLAHARCVHRGRPRAAARAQARLRPGQRVRRRPQPRRRTDRGGARGLTTPVRCVRVGTGCTIAAPSARMPRSTMRRRGSSRRSRRPR